MNFILSIILVFCLMTLCQPASGINTLENGKVMIDTGHVFLDNGRVMNYRFSGKGKKHILLVHGLGSNAKAFDKLLPQLDESYTAYAIDLSNCVDTITLADYAMAIKSFCESKKLKDMTLLGHSMGGQVALTFAHEYPGLLDKLILLAPAGFETFSKTEQNWFHTYVNKEFFKSLSDQQVKSSFDINFFGDSLPVDAHFMLEDRMNIRSSADLYDRFLDRKVANIKAMLSAPVVDLMPKINTPTLVVFGLDDNLIPNKLLHPNLSIRDVAQSGINLLPNAKLVLLEDTGHFIPWERANELSELILHF